MKNTSDNAGLRFALTLFTALMAVLAVSGLAVALNFEFAQMFTRVAMWGCSGFWVLAAISNWIDRFKEEKNALPFWGVWLISFLALVLVAGTYTHRFTTFIIWTNAVTWTSIFVVMLIFFPSQWRHFGTETEKSDDDSPYKDEDDGIDIHNKGAHCFGCPDHHEGLAEVGDNCDDDVHCPDCPEHPIHTS